ncbi:retrotransposon protein, putative, ty1-copia subclass [Tanacetum coccineum]
MVVHSKLKELCTHKGSFLLQKNECDTILWSISNVDNQDVYDIDVCRIVTPMLKQCVFFKETGLVPEKAEACSKLLEVDSPELFPCKSALFDSCRGFHHEQQLTKGAEILTHVWLLIARLGITEQFQIRNKASSGFIMRGVFCDKIPKSLPLFPLAIRPKSTPFRMALPAQNINHSAFRSMFDKEKLSGNNFNDWFARLKLVLRVEKKMHVIDSLLPPLLEPFLKPNVCGWFMDKLDMIGGKTYADYVLKIKGYVEQLERLGYALPQDVTVGLILNGLTKDFVGFVRNYNMHNMGKIIGEIHAMLIEYEKGGGNGKLCTVFLVELVKNKSSKVGAAPVSQVI